MRLETRHGRTQLSSPSALKKAAMKGKDSYYEMEKYSRITTWVLLALLGVVIVRGLISRLRHHSNARIALSVLAIPGYATITAICRGIGYYRPKKSFRVRRCSAKLCRQTVFLRSATSSL